MAGQNPPFLLYRKREGILVHHFPLRICPGYSSDLPLPFVSPSPILSAIWFVFAFRHSISYAFRVFRFLGNQLRTHPYRELRQFPTLAPDHFHAHSVRKNLQLCSTSLLCAL